MKCEKCEHLIRTSYEYGEYACEIFGDEPPCFLYAEDGCKLRWNEAKKLANLGDSVHYGTYQWYGRNPTKEEAENYAKKLEAYQNYWSHIRDKYKEGVDENEKENSSSIDDGNGLYILFDRV